MDIKGHILNAFKSEAVFARHIGWSRQRLNKITTGGKLPSIFDISEIAHGLGMSASEVFCIFLEENSPNG